MRYLGLLTVLSVLLYSCTNERVNQHLSEIQRLQKQVDSSEVVFKSIDIPLVKKNKLYAEDQMDFITSFYHDSTNFDNAKYIDVYYANYKLMKKLVKGHERLASEISYTQSQLTDLYTDVSNGLVSDSLYPKYFQGEENATQSIVEAVGKLKEWELKTTKRFNGMVQPIDSIILALQNNGYR